MGLFAGGGVWMRFAAVTVTYGALARRASAVHTPLAVGLGYCCAVHALVTTLVVADVAPWLIGKNPADGQVPIWSWLVWGPFHLTNRFFVGVAKLNHSRANNLAVATEVWPGWYLGGLPRAALAAGAVCLSWSAGGYARPHIAAAVRTCVSGGRERKYN